MSIPDRLWRVAKGQWALAKEKIAAAESQADAYRELADAIKQSPPTTLPPTTIPGAAPAVPGAPVAGGGRDPLETSYALLHVHPGATLQDVERAFEQRMSETHPERYSPGTPERALEEGKREALQAAYGKVRDALNPTETRFEHLEF